MFLYESQFMQDNGEGEAVEAANVSQAVQSPSALSCGSDKVSVWGDGDGKSNILRPRD